MLPYVTMIIIIKSIFPL